MLPEILSYACGAKSSKAYEDFSTSMSQVEQMPDSRFSADGPDSYYHRLQAQPHRQLMPTCWRKAVRLKLLCVVLRRRMWMLLQVHAKQCQRSDCPVPRCKELREMRRRAVVRQEDQRRVAYKNMVRLRIAAPIHVGGRGSLGVIVL